MIREYSNKKFNRLLVLYRSDDDFTKWVCICDCGKRVLVPTSNLTTGKKKSCGCLYWENVSKMSTKHGLSKTSEFRSWQNIRRRCYDSNHENYKYYGGRGIKVCDRWMNSFENFIADIGLKPTKLHSLDRVNTNGNYEPSNCKWSTQKEQCRNRRSNCFIEYNGKIMSIAELSEISGIPNSYISAGLKNKSVLELINFYRKKGKCKI